MSITFAWEIWQCEMMMGLPLRHDFLPDAQVLSLAKKSGRSVLLTGESDFNRENTKAVLEKGLEPQRIRPRSLPRSAGDESRDSGPDRFEHAARIP